MIFLLQALAVTIFASVSNAHLVLTYPGWRGDNLKTNGTHPQDNPDTRGIDFLPDGQLAFPYGMQWMYPCGGMPLTTNRTKWPVNGGALSFQPGWFAGHAFALIYVNIGIQGPGDLNPPNMSHPVVPPFQIVGPSNNLYQGNICIPQIGMPPNLNFSIGDNITIQVIETAQHGAALYSCVDVTLADPKDVEPVTRDNCQNASWLQVNQLFTSANLTSAAFSTIPNPPTLVSLLSTVALVSVFAGSLWL